MLKAIQGALHISPQAYIKGTPRTSNYFKTFYENRADMLEDTQLVDDLIEIHKDYYMNISNRLVNSLSVKKAP